MNQKDLTRKLAEDDDVQGHGAKGGRADAETDEGDDDVQGHRAKGGHADAETDEGDDDVQGHRAKSH